MIIRTWNQEHTKYGKGVTLTLCEMALLQDLMKGWLTDFRTDALVLGGEHQAKTLSF